MWWRWNTMVTLNWEQAKLAGLTDEQYIHQRDLAYVLALLDSLMNKIVPAENDLPEFSYEQIHDQLLEIKKYIELMK